ncbi:MAG: hypothetical protein MJ107_08125 [Lachnospiraceae bacterium]|nr:hypothetical protein [Lachnospiraceae bacterium]
MAIERSDIHHFVYFLYGEAFYGSYKGMRYRLACEPLEHLFFVKPDERGPHNIRAYAWKEPLSFAKAEDKVFADFDYTEEGVVEAVKWLNEKWSEITGQQE